MTDTTSAPTGRRAGFVAPRLSGTVRIVGAGLLGASIGHALRTKGVDVVLTDASPAQLRLAVDYGAGRLPAEDDSPSLIVVAVPPDVTADVIQVELERFPHAVVTDVASVKLEPFRTLRARGVDLARYIGSHPLAGRERGGAISARADLFIGRPWVVCRDEETKASDLALVEALALDVGAMPLEMTPEEHDRSVALTSHVPQVVASLLAGRLAEAEEGALRLAGQGVRDTTRIAASAPELWVQILGRTPHPWSRSSTRSRPTSGRSPTPFASPGLPAPAASWPRRSVRATTASSAFPASTDRTSASNRSSSWSTTPPGSSEGCSASSASSAST